MLLNLYLYLYNAIAPLTPKIIDKAKEIAGMLFYSNPFKIFKLEGKI